MSVRKRRCEKTGLVIYPDAIAASVALAKVQQVSKRSEVPSKLFQCSRRDHYHLSRD